MQISTVQPSVQSQVSALATDPAMWVRACVGNVEMAAAAVEIVYGCFRATAAQQASLATRVMTLATNGTASGGTMVRPVQPTKLSYQSCDLAIGSLIEALEIVRQASADIHRLVQRQTETLSSTTHG